MFWLGILMCLLSTALMSKSIELSNLNSTSTKPSVVENRQRALVIEDRQDITNYQGYFPYPAPSYPPPTYGPPPPEPPPSGRVVLEFAFDEIVLRCVSEEPFEHLVWLRYQCPQQFLFGMEGTHIADGSNVDQDSLYDVHIRGHDGTIISELLIKRPMDDDSAGIYQCEAWPHIHGGGGGGGYYYNPYQSYAPPKSNVFIIGGNSLLEDCYRFSPGTKIAGITNKEGTNQNKDVKTKQNMFTFKPRRNTSESRKDVDSKQLRYNLKYVDNTLYNVNGENVTAEFFRPSKINPYDFNSLHRNSSRINTTFKYPNNFSLSHSGFIGRSNDKFRDLSPKLNFRQGKILDMFSNESVTSDG